VTFKSVPLLSLQVAGRLVAMMSGSLWVETGDTGPVRRWGVYSVLERRTTFPSADLTIRAKTGPLILLGQAKVSGTGPLPNGYYSLELQGAGQLTGADQLLE
jgi:hypothetical protein